MFGKTASCGAFVGIVTLALMVMLPWAAWGGSGPQALRVEKPSVVEGYPIMTDSELNSMCGRYDGYFFGLDLNVNLCGGPLFSVTADPRSTGLKNGDFSPIKNQYNQTVGYKYGDTNNNNNPVNYQAGIGTSSVYQTVQVNGTGIPVTGLVNLNIEVPKSLTTFGRTVPLSVRGGGPAY